MRPCIERVDRGGFDPDDHGRPDIYTAAGGSAAGIRK